MTYEQISPQEAKGKVDREKDVIILDVRTREEYDSGHIKNAVCLPNDTILREPEILPDKDRKILVYCRSGKRSRQGLSFWMKNTGRSEHSVEIQKCEEEKDAAVPVAEVDLCL